MMAAVRVDLDSGVNARITEERNAAQPDAVLLKDYRDYLRGIQLDPRTQAQRAMFPELEKHAFCDNVCRRVIVTPANRLTIARFDVDGAGAATDRIKEYLAKTAMLNRLSAFVTSVNVATVRDGDHAVALRWRDGATRYIREKWWNGEEGIFVAYDDDGMPLYAVKEWTETQDARQVRRRVVWYPERIERYASEDGQAWQMFNLPSDPYQGGQPVPWVTPDGEPIGIMLVHFANQIVPNDGAGGTGGVRADSRYGMSLLAGGVLGIQDRINLIHFDIVSTSSFTGTQMLWATGVTLPIDPVTKLPTPYRVVPGSVVTSGEKDSHFGSFPAGNVDAHEKALGIQKQAVAEATGLPYVALTGQTPSGEALMHMEADLAEVVDKIGEVMGPGYASLMHKDTRLANIFGKADLDETLRIETVFTPSQRSNPLAVANQLVQLMQVEGRRETLKDIGKQPDDIERIVKEVEGEQRQATENTARAFNAGADAA